MRILHIGNTAGVASVIAKFMDRMFDTKSFVVMRKVFDKYGLTIYGEAWDCGAKVFAFKCFLLARKFDIVHVHDFDKIVPLLKLFYSNKPVVLHYHGSRIRNQWKERKKFWSKADVLLYSVKDVEDSSMPLGAVWMPNPVNTEFFKPLNINRKPNSALSIDTHLNKEQALKFASKHNLQLTIKTANVPHRLMPSLLNQFEFYIDVKTTGFSMSKTGLEALACGCKVINYHGEIVDKLPEEHKPENVILKLKKIYERLSRHETAWHDKRRYKKATVQTLEALHTRQRTKLTVSK